MIKGGNDMKEWMTIKDLGEYLQIPESRIRSLINQERIPFHNSRGFLRFNRQEIDQWMKTPSPEQAIKSETVKAEKEDTEYIYQGKSIKDYMLTADKILIGESAWTRLPDFIKKAVIGIGEHNRDYLYRDEFRPFHTNFNDYLRISCQLGLIDKVGKEEEDSRIKRYYPTNYARNISLEKDIETIKKVILDSVLHIVKKHSETKPDERHSILLLWYMLKIKDKGLVPQEYHFKLSKDKPDNYFPRIRLGFTSSLCYFFFNDDRKKEQEFLAKWERLL